MKILFLSGVLDNRDYEALGIMSLSAMARQSGHRTRFGGFDYKKTRNIMEEFSPDAVAFSVTTGISSIALKLNADLKKEYKFISLFGGPHATYFPEMVEEDGVDGVCIGEGEHAVVDMLDALEHGGDPRRIMNWWFKDKGEIYKNEVRPLIGDLDELPFPDRETLYDEYESFRISVKKTFMASRGCPYSCTYCYNSSYKKLYHGKGRLLRRRSVDNFIRELKAVKDKYPMKLAWFQDDCFTADKKWCLEFAERFRNEVGIEFSCNSRFESIDEEVMKAFKKAGCRHVDLGIESGDYELRREMLNRNMTDELILKKARIIKDAGLKLFTYNILGAPGATLEKDFKTIKLNIECKSDYQHISIYQPYPKTELADKAIQMGLYDAGQGKFSASFFDSSLLRLKDRRQIENLQKLGALTISFPAMMPLTRLLIKLPLGGFYNLVRRVWEGCLSLRHLNPRMGMRELFLKSVKHLVNRHA